MNFWQTGEQEGCESIVPLDGAAGFAPKIITDPDTIYGTSPPRAPSIAEDDYESPRDH